MEKFLVSRVTETLIQAGSTPLNEDAEIQKYRNVEVNCVFTVVNHQNIVRAPCENRVF